MKLIQIDYKQFVHIIFCILHYFNGYRQTRSLRRCKVPFVAVWNAWRSKLKAIHWKKFAQTSFCQHMQQACMCVCLSVWDCVMFNQFIYVYWSIGGRARISRSNVAGIEYVFSEASKKSNYGQCLTWTEKLWLPIK